MSVEAALAAIREGDPSTVKDLLTGDPALQRARDEQGISLLMQALYHRQSAIADLFADGRSDLDLFEAVAIGNLPRAKELLDEKPSSTKDRTADGFTALHYAAFFGRPEAARLLIELGSEVSVAADNPMKVHPLHSAAAINQNEICRQLLEAGADPNAQQHGGYTALMSAAMHGNEDLVRMLLDQGADVALAAEDGKTALAFAEEKGHQTVASLLAAAC